MNIIKPPEGSIVICSLAKGVRSTQAFLDAYGDRLASPRCAKRAHRDAVTPMVKSIIGKSSWRFYVIRGFTASDAVMMRMTGFETIVEVPPSCFTGPPDEWPDEVINRAIFHRLP